MAKQRPAAVRVPVAQDSLPSRSVLVAVPEPGRVIAAAAVVFVAALLIFIRLDQRVLYIDEAETALLGRTTLAHGIPTAHDGKNLISQELEHEHDARDVWRWTPWLEKYMTAASFAVLGESTFSARFPFALLGLLSVVSMYPLALAWFRDRWVGVLAMAFLALSVPFLLHVRQCRYYSITIFASIWVFYFLMGLVRGRRGAVLGFTLAMTGVFEANTLTFMATCGALVPCVLWLGVTRAVLWRAALAAVFIAILNAPWFFYFDILGRTGHRLDPYWWNVRILTELTAHYTFPFVALLLFLLLAWWFRKRRNGSGPPLLDRHTWRAFASLLTFGAACIFALSMAPWCYYRYMANLLPLAALLMAVMCGAVLRWQRVVGVIFTACLLLTGVFHEASVWPFSARLANLPLAGRSFPVFDTFFPLGNYLYEVTHPYVGPMEGLLQFLRQHVRPEDRIYISYGDLILKFYMNNEIRGGQTGQTFSGMPEPEWLIIRGFFRYTDRAEMRADTLRTMDWLNNEAPQEHYDKLPDSWRDHPWDDIPEPQFHWFRTLDDAQPPDAKWMQVYRLRAAPAPAAVP